MKRADPSKFKAGDPRPSIFVRIMESMDRSFIFLGRIPGFVWKLVIWDSGIAKAFFGVMESIQSGSAKIGSVLRRGWLRILNRTIFTARYESAVHQTANLAQTANKVREGTLLRFMERLERQRLFRWIPIVFGTVKNGSTQVGYFCIEWIISRRFRNLLFGIPALLMVIPLAYFLIRLPFYGPQAKAKHYQKVIQDAEQSDDFETASLFYRKLYQLKAIPDPRIIFRSALTLHQIDTAEGKDTTRGIEKMKTIAPLDRPGFAPAHYWLAAIYRHQTPNAGIAKTLEPKIEKHLKHVLHLEPHHAEAAVLLAELYLKNEDRESAQKVIEKHGDKPNTLFAKIELTKLHTVFGNSIRARSLALQCDQEFTQQHKELQQKDQSLAVIDFFGWAIATEILGEDDRVKQVLDLARESHPNDVGLKNLISRWVWAKLQHKQAAGVATDDDRFQVIEQLLEVQPDSSIALSNLSSLATSNDQRLSQAALQILETQSTRKNVVAMDVMANLALYKNDPQTAREKFEAILKISPNDSSALNNVAWMYAHSEPQRLNDSIKLINRAIELDPRNPHYRDTKGHVLMKMEKWEDAIDELRIAINGLPGNAAAHSALAACYQKLGQTESAEAHRRMAQSLK